MKIGYQGIKGAYSEAALYRHFGEESKAFGFERFSQVFDAVESRKVDYGLIPVENSITGSVTMNYDLLLARNVKIIAEIDHAVKHSLLSHKGSRLADIKKAYSHPQALSQCDDFLSNNNITPVSEYNTAGAAMLISNRNKKGEAAIASSLCAEIYDLEIIEKDIQTDSANTTRFFVIAKDYPKDLKKEKTSIVFKTKHYSGALVNCLQRLGKNNINLTKLESRPIPGDKWEYMFFADFEGGTDDENVKLALNEMEAASLYIKVLGSYPKAKK